MKDLYLQYSKIHKCGVGLCRLPVLRVDLLNFIDVKGKSKEHEEHGVRPVRACVRVVIRVQIRLPVLVPGTAINKGKHRSQIKQPEARPS